MKVEVNEKLVLVGTAHVSQVSVKEVEEAIRQYEPDVVAVELDEKRLEVLLNKKKWEETPITDMIRGGKAPFFLAQVFLASIQRRLGKEFGAEPGSEMLAAVKEAEKNAIRVELVDRDITITMRKAWRTMGFREKFRLFWEFSKAMVGYSDEEEIDLEEIMNEDVITMLIEELSEIAPSVTKILVFERDAYIAKKLSGLSEEGKVVAVVGAGHLKGIQENLAKIHETPSFEDLNAVPKKRIRLGKAIAYAIPILFFTLLIWLVYNGLTTQDPDYWDNLSRVLFTWFIINGICSAIGAALARGHPYSIATAFIAAPFTSLNPAVAAGWFAGAVEAKVRTPTVKDFQDLSVIETTKQFLNNRVIRVLMVAALANIGSVIGTFIAGAEIFRIVFS
ncbi:MAG: TraB/GumN family protein [Methanomassiliicoccales archaeon]|nr:MAG: TraB/GumN family protein [Methanomassiliicoccales archaeon]